MKFLRIKSFYCIQILIGMCCVSNGLCSVQKTDHHKCKTSTNDPHVLTLRLGPNINLNQTDSVNSNRSKIILVNVENSSANKIDNVIQRILQKDAATETEIKLNNTNREKRDVSVSSSSSDGNKNSDKNSKPQGYYYEEQSPVVIHSEAGPMSISNEAAISRAWPSSQEDSRFDSDSIDYNYGRSGNVDDYEYANDYGSPFGEEQIEANDARNTIESSAVGRSNQWSSSYNPSFESYYRQQTGTPSISQRQPQGHEYFQKPYGTYDNEENNLNRPSQTQYRQKPQKTTSAALDTSEEPSSFLSIIERVKSIWEMYQAFSSALNQIAERQRHSYQRMSPPALPESRINSKKPTNFDGRNDNVTAANVTSSSSPSSSSFVPKDLNRKYNSSNDTRTTFNNSVERYRRDAVKTSTETSIVKDEGRYIKGDPLKGYYDFVITEGSYKFWAAFQVGTAILIIYSTFAAIYYSKVNPLVSDYDYTDYLGGGRSLSGDGDGDADFVDDDTTGTMPDDDAAAANRTPKWLNMAGHTVKFILDAIDRIPQEDQLSNKDDGGRSSNHY